MHIAHGDGVAGIKRRRRDQSSDIIKNLATTSGRGRLKMDLESSTWDHYKCDKATDLGEAIRGVVHDKYATIYKYQLSECLANLKNTCYMVSGVGIIGSGWLTTGTASFGCLGLASYTSNIGSVVYTDLESAGISTFTDNLIPADKSYEYGDDSMVTDISIGSDILLYAGISSWAVLLWMLRHLSCLRMRKVSMFGCMLISLVFGLTGLVLELGFGIVTLYLTMMMIHAS
ncbi:hypothetical protein Tco_0731003 [Tanacetum coccineum]